MPHRSILFSLACCFLFVSAWVLPPAQAQETAEATIDLERDDDQDGIPDELAAEVQQIEALATIAAARANEGDTAALNAATAALDTAITDMARRLPYAPHTRALQEEAARLSEQLFAVDDPAEGARIAAELEALSAQMMDDPAYARSMEALAVLLAPPAAQHSVYLPMLMHPGTATATAPQSTERAVQVTVAYPGTKGDVVLITTNDWSSVASAFVYRWNWGHAGVSYDNTRVYESNADGVRLRPWSVHWDISRARIWGGEALSSSGRSKVRSALDALVKPRSQGGYGTNGETPYNWAYWDKNTDAKLYCSQLAWKIYRRAGIDIDSNDWRYKVYIVGKWGSYLGIGGGIAAYAFADQAVAPDEIALDPDLRKKFEYTIR